MRGGARVGAGPRAAAGALALAALVGFSTAPPAVAQDRAQDGDSSAPKNADSAPFDVELTTADGMQLAGTYYPPKGRPATGAPSVVALHMYRNVRASYAPIAPAIQAQGMGLLAIDMRGHGESTVQDGKDVSIAVRGRDADVFNAMHHDAWAGVRWLQRHKQVPKGKVALLGASVGCSVAIDTAVRHPSEIACVVALTPGLNYLGVPTQEHLQKWPQGKPLFVLASEGEKAGGAEPIHEALADKGCEIHVMPGARELHGTRMFGNVEGIEGKVAAWIHAKTDGVDLTDGRVQAYERHGRRELKLGDEVTAFVGTSGSKLYCAAVANEGKTLAPKSTRVAVRVVSETSSAPRKGFDDLPVAALDGTPWKGAEALFDTKALRVEPGATVRVVVTLTSASGTVLSQPVKVKLP